AQGVAAAGMVPFTLGVLALVGGSLTAVAWQYARRKPWRSRALLLAALAALPIFQLVTPYRILIDYLYPRPAPGIQPPVRLAFDPAKLALRKGGYPEKNKMHIWMPLLVSGVADGWNIKI